MATSTSTATAIHWIRLPVSSSGVWMTMATQAAVSSSPKMVGTTTVSQCGCRSRSTFSPLANTFSGNPTTPSFPGGCDEDECLHPVGSSRRQGLGHHSSHRDADDDARVDAELVPQTDD